MALQNVTFEELKSLLKEVKHYYFLCSLTPSDFDPARAEDADAFLKFLKLNTKTEQLDTLIKLGADKKDCSMHNLIEDLTARKRTRGRHSLLWQAAKSVNENGGAKKRELPDDIEVVLQDSKRFARGNERP